MAACRLDTNDYDRLVSLLSGLPAFRTEHDRWDFIENVLQSSPRQHDILMQLDLSGVPRSAASRLVNRLSDFGQDVPGRCVLGVLINRLIDGAYVMDPQEVDFLRGLVQRYQLDQQVIASSGVDRWFGKDTGSTVQEKIIGENTLRDISMLERALEASHAVVRVVTQTGTGTGFLVAPDMLMTNHHVIGSESAAQGCMLNFKYQRDRLGNPAPGWTCGLNPSAGFSTNAALDYTLVALEAAQPVEPLRLKAVRLERDARVSIIQHPGGYYKQISMQNNFVVFANEQVVQYITSTLPGSSGSPVFDDAYDVVAIHHSGGEMLEPGTNRRYLRNAGTSMIAILKDVRERSPHLAARLKL